jgi:hypothetical protein
MKLPWCLLIFLEMIGPAALGNPRRPYRIPHLENEYDVVAEDEAESRPALSSFSLKRYG